MERLGRKLLELAERNSHLTNIDEVFCSQSFVYLKQDVPLNELWLIFYDFLACQ